MSRKDLGTNLLKALKNPSVILDADSNPIEKGKDFDDHILQTDLILKSYVRTCLSLKKDIMNDVNTPTSVAFHKNNSSDSFVMIIEKPLARYRRITTLPIQIRPYFEKLVRTYTFSSED